MISKLRTTLCFDIETQPEKSIVNMPTVNPIRDVKLIKIVFTFCSGFKNEKISKKLCSITKVSSILKMVASFFLISIRKVS